MLYKVHAVHKWGNANRKLGTVPKKMKTNPRSCQRQVSFFLPTKSFAGMMVVGEPLELFNSSSKNVGMALSCVPEL